MIESFTGLILLIASGLFGREILLKEQPSLKVTLHHLEAYRDATGVILIALTLGGIYHSISTALTHQYPPLYWCAWSLSSLIGFVIGVAISADLWSVTLTPHAPRLGVIGQAILEYAQRSATRYTWTGLALGAWRFIHPWVG